MRAITYFNDLHKGLGVRLYGDVDFTTARTPARACYTWATAFSGVKIAFFILKGLRL